MQKKHNRKMENLDILYKYSHRRGTRTTFRHRAILAWDSPGTHQTITPKEAHWVTSCRAKHHPGEKRMNSLQGNYKRGRLETERTNERASVRTNEWTSERTNERTAVERTDGRSKGRTRMIAQTTGRPNEPPDGRTNERTSEQTNSRTSNQTNGRAGGQASDRTDARVNERTDDCTRLERLDQERESAATG